MTKLFKAILVTAALLEASVFAANATSLSLGIGNWAIVLSTSQLVNPLVAVNRDVYNGQWAIGYGMELLPVDNTSVDGVTREVLFVGAVNEFVVGDSQGIFGLNVGVHLPTALLQGYEAITGDGDIISELPPFLQKVNQYTSLDFGAGYRPFGVPVGLAAQGVKAFSYGPGFYCTIPFGDLFNTPGSL